jgi:hypothetical protein
MSKITGICMMLLGMILLGSILFLFWIMLNPSETAIAASFIFFAISLALIGMVLLGIYSAFLESMKGNKQLKKYKERDPLVCERVVKDGYEGPDYLIRGSGEETFGHACQKQWQFVKTDRRAGWIIKDERGNDITGSSLESYDGIAVILKTAGKESISERPESDTSSDYTSIDEGVEYYD